MVEDNQFLSLGAESKINLYKKESFNVNIFGGINRTERSSSYVHAPLSKIENKYFEFGTDLTFYGINLNLIYFNIIDFNHGYNVSLFYNSDHLRGYVHIDYNDIPHFPEYNVKTDISYQDLFFDDHLILRVGLNLKYIYNLSTLGYNQMNYNYTSVYSNSSEQNSKNSFNADFYIGARIGKANVNFTVANIFNNFNYNTYLYPEDDRGGFLRSISRFTIVWDFLD